MAPPCRPVRMMRVDPSEPQPCAERPAPRRAPMYVERAQRLTAAPLVPCPTLTLAPLVAMLDQADAGDASLLTRLGALTAFTRATDEAFADMPAETLEPLRELVARHSAVAPRPPPVPPPPATPPSYAPGCTPLWPHPGCRSSGGTSSAAGRGR